MAKLGKVVCGQAPLKAAVDLGHVTKAAAGVIETLQEQEEKLGLTPMEGAFALVLGALLLVLPEEHRPPQDAQALGAYLEKALHGALLAALQEVRPAEGG